MNTILISDKDLKRVKNMGKYYGIKKVSDKDLLSLFIEEKYFKLHLKD